MGLVCWGCCWGVVVVESLIWKMGITKWNYINQDSYSEIFQ